MTYREDGSGKPEKLKFRDHPSWKVATKNNKQWIKKRFLQRRHNHADGTITIYYGW